MAIIHDDESVRESIDAFLRSAGLQLAIFASAEEFVRSDRLSSTDCLVLDLRMPDMDGLELQQRLAADGHHRS